MSLLTTDNVHTPLDLVERFPDLHPALDRRAAVVEAHRCLNCFDAPCMGACPTHIDVPRFIKKIASGNITGSARAILEANVLGASCSRVCPVEVLCEGSCVMHGRGEKAIEIGRLQRFAMETYYGAGGTIPLRERRERPERVACIGGGPASLACAAELRQQGLQVTIFDKRTLPGGLNTYGVAEYKLRAEDSLREVERVRGLGVEFARKDVDAHALREIEREFDAVFLGVGLGEMHRLKVDGAPREDAESSLESLIVDALNFIAAYKSGGRTRAPARVVVVGAGNTAIDAACAARRLGAEQVTVVYRRRQEHMSAFGFEYEHALREGVGFVWETVPVGVRRANGGLELRCVRMMPDPDGEWKLLEGSEFTLVCDLVVPAIGQSPLLEMLGPVPALTVSGGRVVIDRATGQTTNPQYFAGGDCVNGGREVVDAVADGKRAGLGITSWLSAGPARQGAPVEARVG